MYTCGDGTDDVHECASVGDAATACTATAAAVDDRNDVGGLLGFPRGGITVLGRGCDEDGDDDDDDDVHIMNDRC